MSVVYGGDKITFSDGSTVGSGWTGFKNRIINGAMMIDQRNAGASVSLAGGNFPVDRMRLSTTGVTSTATVQQNLNSITPPVGFQNYIGMSVTSGAATGSTAAGRITQRIEGFNVADFGFGATGASTVTLSFWVRSSLTGTFGGSLQNNDGNRVYVFSYTINSANTWEQKTITIAGDTTGTWLKTNGMGMLLLLSVGSGSTFQGSAGSWGSTYYDTVTGQVDVLATTGATFYITGVQLEKGSTATSFDYRSYSVEELLCKRYCHVWSSGGQSYTWVGMGFTYSGGATAHYRFPVIMRASPTATFSEQNKWIADYFNGNSAVTGMSISYVSPEQCRVNATCSPPTNYPFALANNGDAGTRTIVFSAEL